MKNNRLYTKLLLAGSLFLVSTGFTSCEDFLTVLPTNQLPEESFWQDKNDLNNVRAGAYNQLAQSGQIGKIMLWGEMRSDNLELYDKKQTSIAYMKDAILQPSEGMFSWEGFYRGINYCNLVLEEGEKMTEPGKEVDPSFTRNDFAPIKNEMLSLRALNYFYLVRAFRDVPYVTAAVRDDAAARDNMPAATPGVAILGELIAQLEESVQMGAVNYGNDRDNKGRFTRTSTYMLMADMCLWRSCMLRYHMNKMNHSIINITDVVKVGEDGLAVPGVYMTKDGVEINKAYADAEADKYLEKSIEYANLVLKDLRAEYDRELNLFPNMFTDLEKEQPYPMYRVDRSQSALGATDVPYYNIIYRQNSRESIFELQYDGSTMYNTAISDYLSDYKDGALKPTKMVVAGEMTAQAAEYNPEKGFGKSDMRLIETCDYESKEASKPFQKFLAGNISFSDLEEVTLDPMVSTYRTPGTSAINWHIYRLVDVMLLKAEAIARKSSPSKDDLKEGFQLVNQVFARSNPALYGTAEESSENPDLVCDRMLLKDKYMAGDNNDFSGLNKADLLTLVYRERQREFIGEGKRWFDIVRQIEAVAENTTAVKNNFSNFMTASNTVKNRLTQLYAFYNPIYSEELKVNGAEVGGKLTQNPVWDRYTKK